MRTRRIVIAATAMALIGLASSAHAQAPTPMQEATKVTAKECTDGGGTVEHNNTDFTTYCKGGTHNNKDVEG